MRDHVSRDGGVDPMNRLPAAAGPYQYSSSWDARFLPGGNEIV
jgi:hypothetical protein